MQVRSSLKASPDLTPGEAAQAPASAETQAFLTANNLQAVEVQLSQPVADISLSRHATNLPDHRTDSNLATAPHVTADASASAQQRESAEPKQAAFVTSAQSASCGFPPFQPLTGEALPLQSTAKASAARTPGADPTRFALSVTLPHMSQEAMMPGATCEQPLQPAEPLQVQMHVMPAFSSDMLTFNAVVLPYIPYANCSAYSCVWSVLKGKVFVS